MKFVRRFFTELQKGVGSGLSVILILLVLGLPLIVTVIYTVGKNPK